MVDIRVFLEFEFSKLAIFIKISDKIPNFPGTLNMELFGIILFNIQTDHLGILENLPHSNTH